MSFASAILLHGLGRRTFMHFLFPLCFLFVAVPIPKLVWNPLVLSLQSILAAVDVELLKTIGIPAVQQGTTIRLANCVVGIDEACSGVRSLQSSMMAALFIGSLVLRRGTSRLWLVVSGVFLALFGNLIRSLILSLAAERGGGAALTRVHDGAGWAILGVTAVGVALCSWLLSRWERRVAGLSDGMKSTGVPTVAEFLPTPASASSRFPIVATALFTAALIGAWAWFNVAVPPAPARYTFYLQKSIEGYRFEPEEVPQAAVEILGTTNLINGRFVGEHEEIRIFAATWGKEADMSVVQHTPDICWVAAGWRPVKLGQPESVRIVSREKQVHFECRVFRSPDRNSKQVAIWCTLLGGSVLPEGTRWAIEDDSTLDSRNLAAASGRRMAVHHLMRALKERVPGTRNKQFLRLSTTLDADDWRSGLHGLQGFLSRFAELGLAK
jgi:exosortase